MRKVLFVASDNNMASGAFRSMAKLCELLQLNFGYTPIVVLPTDGDGENLLDDASIRYVRIKSYDWVVPLGYEWTVINRMKRVVKKLLNKNAVNKIAKLIKKEKIDILHSNTTYTYVGALAAKKANIPCVWHLRELLEEDQSNQIWDTRGIQLINSVTKVVAISNFVYDKYQNQISDNKLVMIPNGIEEQDFYVERIKNNNKMLEFLCVGGLYEGKGQATIIQACAVLVKKGMKDFHVSFVGRGEKQKEYEQLVHDLNLEQCITLCGAHKDVLPFYKKADVMIMSSRAEAFGRTTVEAMMAGCAIIGSNSGGTPEILDYGNCGYLFENGNYMDLAGKMEHVIKNRSELAEMAQRGQKYALETFTAKLNATKIAELYHQIEHERCI